MSDLIIKDAGEIKDGLYNIKDGKLFKYKANGGTVRTYPIVSADRPTGHWIEHDDERVLCECSECHEKYLLYEEHVLGRNFCPNCGCVMKGGEEE